MKKCLKCGKENIEEATYCANCGAKLNSISNNSNKCPQCGKENHKDVTYCTNCGARLHSISNNNSSASSSNSSSKESNTNQKTDEGPDTLKICCCYVPVILLIIATAWALIYHNYAESFSTDYGDEFNYLDSNGDGKLSFDEISHVDWYVDDSKLNEYFDDADTNHNGFLKGHEFDLFVDDVIDETSSSSEDSSSDNDKYKYSSSSSSRSSSGSSKYRNDLNNHEYDSSSEGYVLTCPYCGSEAVYESGNGYRCAECGSYISNPDDLELGYQEGYMDLMVPVGLMIS